MYTPAYGTAVLINFGPVQSVATVIDVASSTVYIANYYFLCYVTKCAAYIANYYYFIITKCNVIRGSPFS